MAERWITDRDPSARWPHYTRANAGEVLPTAASPLGQQFSWEKGILLGWRDGYVRSGNYSLDEFTESPPAVAGFFAGYFYINLANVRMQGVRSPAVTVEQLDLAFFGNHPEVPPYVAHPLDERPDLLELIGAHLGWLMTATTWPEINDEKVQTIAFRASRPDLTKLTDVALVARARSTQPMLQKLFESHTLPSSGSGVAPGILFAVGEAIGDPTIPMKIVAGIGEVDSAEPSYAMWKISRLIRGSQELTSAFDAGVTGLLDRLRASSSADASTFLVQFDQFIADFGSRGPNEWEMSAEVWETKPEIVLAAFDRVRFQTDEESPEIRNKRQAKEREQAIIDVRAKVQVLGEELAGMFESAIVASAQLMFRERTKTNIIRVVHEGRMAFRELGRRHAVTGAIKQADHIFMLLDEEVEDFIKDPAAMAATLATRYGQWMHLQTLEPPFFIKNGIVPPLSQYQKKGSSAAVQGKPGESIQGVAGCPGHYIGRARVILDAAEPGDLQPGDVMIAPNTDPAWTPLFMSCGAVVVNVGGQISHAIIVSRELGLPCVVSATDATVRIPDGALVEVNGDNGIVTILELPA
ncbi:MAG: hypothetical protein EXQ64_02975 [Ilumatobacteraceae bacterium]|nr:hypothetical protein [Ilumatobacteraceae bacterium]